jgi:C-terminal processing protease CtpA/Prc
MTHSVINQEIRVEVIQSLTKKLRANYVFPEIAEQICIRLQKHLEDGDYADVTEGEFFAYVLTTHLQEINQDEHLWVRWHPEPLPDQEEALRLNQAWVEEQKQAAQLDNYGFYKIERLPGNIGYLDIRYFYRPSWGGDVAAAVMSAIANTNALIIDLRQCPGGYPGMVALVSSYLFGDTPVHLDSIYWRDDDFTQQYWTLPYVPGQRFGDKPVYVLVSKETFSAGEAFAYNLQALRRATIVGEQTDGGAHPGASYRLHPHFEIFIPVGRGINPTTKTDFEGTGVIPDVPTTVEQALSMAHKLALESVIEQIGESASVPLRKLLEEAQAALERINDEN